MTETGVSEKEKHEREVVLRLAFGCLLSALSACGQLALEGVDALCEGL